MNRNTTSSSQRGIVLIWVLWVGTLLGLIAGSYLFGVRAGITAVSNAGERLQAEALAESGINHGILTLLNAEPVERWRLAGSLREMAFGTGRFEYWIQAESGKIDLNAAPETLLAGLGVPKLVDAIMSRRRTDAGFVRSIDELEEFPNRLRSAVTVYSGRPTLNPLVAARTALDAVPGLNPGAIGTFVESSDREAILPALVGGGNEHLALHMEPVYTIRAKGIARGGAAAFKQAVVRMEGDSSRPFKVLSWEAVPAPLE